MRYGWAPYVPVAIRRARAAKQMERLRRKGQEVCPVTIEGRRIARTFWGRAWCEHLESLSDYENRLPRGRTYVRNGSVCHLGIEPGKVTAIVAGSALYHTNVAIKTLPKKRWGDLKRRCVGRIGSLLELLQGRLSDEVMAVVTDGKGGMFPLPREIAFDCDCPDWASMCKHVASVLYGIGARLDERPELLFLLRGVDHAELISEDAAESITARARSSRRRRLDESRLSGVFGIDLDAEAGAKRAATRKSPGRRAAKTRRAPAGTARKASRKRKAQPPPKPASGTGKVAATKKAAKPRKAKAVTKVGKARKAGPAEKARSRAPGRKTKKAATRTRKAGRSAGKTRSSPSKRAK